MIRQECYQTIGYYDPRLSQLPDFDFWLRLLIHYQKSPIHILQEELILFRILNNERNTSTPRPSAMARQQWELTKILPHYLKILSLADYQKIFKQAAMHFTDAELIPFYIAQHALNDLKTPYRFFGMETVYRLLADNRIREKIEKDHHYSCAVFTRANGNYKIFLDEPQDPSYTPPLINPLAPGNLIAQEFFKRIRRKIASIPAKIKNSIKQKICGLKKKIKTSNKKKKKCPLCAYQADAFHPLPKFYPDMLKKHRFLHSLDKFETLELNDYSCPQCTASDRDRLYALYIQQKLFEKQSSARFRLLDIAPSASLGHWLKSQRQFKYRSCDLYDKHVDDQIDICDMKAYPDQSFEAIICSHVLEHVADDKKAVKEIYRVLADRGWAIIMVPISLAIHKNLEDPSMTTEEQRWHCYGQGDHARLYSKQGFLELLKGAGFHVKQYAAADFEDGAFSRHAINQKSILYVAFSQPKMNASNYTYEELDQMLGSVGENVRIHRSVQLFNAKQIFIGSNVRIDCFCLLTAGNEGIHIGSHIHIGAASHLFGNSGKVSLEDFCNISSRVSIFTANDDYTHGYMTNPTVPEEFKSCPTRPGNPSQTRDRRMRQHHSACRGNQIWRGRWRTQFGKTHGRRMRDRRRSACQANRPKAKKQPAFLRRAIYYLRKIRFIR